MTGMLRVRVAHSPDGDQQVMTLLPNGARFLLGPAESLAYAFAILMVARDLFPSKQALDAAVPEAYDRSSELLSREEMQ
jgi:hypothetical protein